MPQFARGVNPYWFFDFFYAYIRGFIPEAANITIYIYNLDCLQQRLAALNTSFSSECIWAQNGSDAGWITVGYVRSFPFRDTTLDAMLKHDWFVSEKMFN